MEPFEDDGVFWLPAKEDEQHTGRLKFDPIEGGTLNLLGGFGDIKDQFNDQSRIIRIHGVAGKRYLTLEGCFNTNTALDMPGIPRQSFYVSQIITGHLFADDQPLAFDKCSVAFDQLAPWVRRSGVTVRLEAPTDTQVPNRIKIDFSELQDEMAPLGEEELRLTSTWSLSGDNITETRLSQGTQLEIRYRSVQSLETILGDVKHLQDLLTLATTAAAVPVEIALWREDITREFRPGETRPQSMSFYASQLAEQVRLNKPQSPQNVLFQFQDIGGLDTIARWVNVARQYHTVSGSLLSIRYASGLYVENRFNNVISATETFHRLRFSNEVMPAADFKEFRRGLVKAVPKEHRNWLGNQLQYSNEPRLRGRLNEMVTYVGRAFDVLFDDHEAWVAVITESRNRLIHHDAERGLDFNPGDLHFLTESVFTLVMLCLFRECDMSGDALAETINGSGSLHFLRGKLTELVPRLHAQIKQH